MIIEDTLDECIRKFMVQPEDQRHLYEIHTAPQSDLVSAIVSADHVVELARLRDFSENEPISGALLNRTSRLFVCPCAIRHGSADATDRQREPA